MSNFQPPSDTWTDVVRFGETLRYDEESITTEALCNELSRFAGALRAHRVSIEERKTAPLEHVRQLDHVKQEFEFDQGFAVALINRMKEVPHQAASTTNKLFEICAEEAAKIGLRECSWAIEGARRSAELLLAISRTPLVDTDRMDQASLPVLRSGEAGLKEELLRKIAEDEISILERGLEEKAKLQVLDISDKDSFQSKDAKIDSPLTRFWNFFSRRDTYSKEYPPQSPRATRGPNWDVIRTFLLTVGARSENRDLTDRFLEAISPENPIGSGARITYARFILDALQGVAENNEMPLHQNPELEVEIAWAERRASEVHRILTQWEEKGAETSGVYRQPTICRERLTLISKTLCDRYEIPKLFEAQTEPSMA